jgi:anaerobic C4-dicarboxylate transporter
MFDIAQILILIAMLFIGIKVGGITADLKKMIGQIIADFRKK